jgi:DNA primase
MPGIDFTILRQQVSLAQVLDLLGFTPATRRGPQMRGPCPIHGSAHGSKVPKSRSFAAHLEKNCWHCFRCGAGGNALDLYLATTRLPVYAGALDLCARLHLPAPRLPAPRCDKPVSQRPRRPP